MDYEYTELELTIPSSPSDKVGELCGGITSVSVRDKCFFTVCQESSRSYNNHSSKRLTRWLNVDVWYRGPGNHYYNAVN